DSSGAADARGVTPRRHRLLQYAAVASDTVAAVVLGGRADVRQPQGWMGFRACRRALVNRARGVRGTSSRRRTVALLRVQPVAGSAEGTLHEIPHARLARTRTAAVAGPKAAPRQGCENLSSRREPVVAVAAPPRARA